MYEQQNTPLSIGGVLDQGFKLLGASFKHVFPLALLSSYVSVLPSLVELGVSEAGIPGLLVLPTFIVVFAVTLTIYGAIVLQIDAVMNSRTPSATQSLGAALRRCVPLFLCGLLYVLAFAGGTVLLVVPGIIFAISLSLSFYLVVVDQAGPLESIKLSHKLVWGNWWRTTAVAAVVFFISVAAYTLFILTVGILRATLGEDSSLWILQLLLAPVVTALISPLFYVFGMAVMRDLKLRKSGADLSERLDAIDSP